jgi:hypothetical protein
MVTKEKQIGLIGSWFIASPIAGEWYSWGGQIRDVVSKGCLVQQWDTDENRKCPRMDFLKIECLNNWDFYDTFEAFEETLKKANKWQKGNREAAERKAAEKERVLQAAIKQELKRREESAKLKLIEERN